MESSRKRICNNCLNYIHESRKCRLVDRKMNPLLMACPYYKEMLTGQILRREKSEKRSK